MGLRTTAVLLTALLGASTILAQASLTQQAANAYTAALEAEKALNEKPPAEQKRNDVLKVISAYQRVYLITPATSYADDAMIAIARLYESIKDTGDAVKMLTFLVREYPQSPFREAARRDIERLNGNSEPVPS